MKWRISKNTYKNGETMLIKKFAFMPVFINGFLIWLSFYDILKAYVVTTTSTDVGTFENAKWVIVSKRIKNNK